MSGPGTAQWTGFPRCTQLGQRDRHKHISGRKQRKDISGTYTVCLTLCFYRYFFVFNLNNPIKQTLPIFYRCTSARFEVIKRQSQHVHVTPDHQPDLRSGGPTCGKEGGEEEGGEAQPPQPQPQRTSSLPAFVPKTEKVMMVFLPLFKKTTESKQTEKGNSPPVALPEIKGR